MRKRDSSVPIRSKELKTQVEPSPANKVWRDALSLRLLKAIPVQCNGLALGLVGVANVILNLHSFGYGSDERLSWFTAVILVACSAANQVAYFCKAIAAPSYTWQCDCSEANVVSAHAWFLTPTMICTTLVRLLPVTMKPVNVAAASLYLSILLWIPIVGRFYQLVFRENNRISIFFFATSFGFCVFAAAGGPFGVPPWLMVSSAWYGVVVLLILYPMSFLRAVANKNEAGGPAIGMLQASSSFVCLSWHGAYNALQKSSSTSLLGPEVVGDVLFAISVIGVLATIYCSWVRVSQLRVSWYSPSWSAFTFPSASSANAALLFALRRPSPLSRGYAAAVCAVVVPLIFTINVANIIHLSRKFAKLRGPGESSKNKTRVDTAKNGDGKRSSLVKIPTD